jgi:hypothetical protein
MTFLRQTIRSLSPARLAMAGGAIALTVLGACADGPTAPAAAPLAPTTAPQAGLLSNVLGAVTGGLATVLKRPTPLAAPVSVAQLIGAEGGRIVVPGTGLTLTVPAGAVRTPTRFTITAPAGHGVWYEFGPSGARFDVPLVVTQELPTTLLSGLLGAPKLDAVYFADGTQNEATGTALAKEILPISLNSTGTRATFKVSHFSGYMVSTGRSRSFSDEQ